MRPLNQADFCERAAEGGGFRVDSRTRCYDYCATPTPEFEVPTCPSGTGTEEPQPTGTGDGGLSIDEKREEEGSFIIRADGIEDCGNGWGA